MSTNYQHITLHQDQHDILWLALDVIGKNANILTPEVLAEISHVCQQTQQQAHLKGIVFYSKKPNGFIAGADIEHFKHKTDHSQDDSQQDTQKQHALHYIQQGQQTCQTIADLTIPSVAMIDGFCMGGGTEIALACDYRVASDSNKTRIGLPEIKLGIHSGFGGTVRSIARLGVQKAMLMMLTGRAYNGYSARKIGLVDYCVPLRQLKNTAIYVIQHQPTQKTATRSNKIWQIAPLRHLIAYKMRQQTAKRVNQAHYPAPFALIQLWQKYGHNSTKMYQQEAHSVARLITTKTAQNLVRVFFLRTRLKAQGKKSFFQPHHIHIVGGGVMGADIAAWCAMQGFAVTLQDMQHDTLAKAIHSARKNISKALKHQPLAIRDSLDRLIPDKDGDGIASADVIIEAIFENLTGNHYS